MKFILWELKFQQMFISCSKNQKSATLIYKFYIVGFLPILNHSCLSAVVPIVPGVVSLIVNTLQFLHSTHQQSNFFGHSFAFDALKILNELPTDVCSTSSCSCLLQENAQNLPVCKSLSAIASHVTPVSP